MWKNKPPFAKRGLIHKEAAAATPKFVAAQLEKDAPAAAAEEPALTPVPYKAGDVVTLKVVRVSECGAFLDAGTGNTSEAILLPPTHTPGNPCLRPASMPKCRTVRMAVSSTSCT